MINIYVILTVASNLLTGMTKLLSLTQAAFYGIGAYLTVLSIELLGLPFIPSLKRKQPSELAGPMCIRM